MSEKPKTNPHYEEVKAGLKASPKRWLITGCAGFIGSNLLEALLKLDQTVIGLDNFSTGYQHNLDEVHGLVSKEQWNRFRFIEGDIRDLETCRQACDGVDYVLHQAALGSVPRSLADPIASNQSNIDGFLNMLVAARDAKVSSFTYAASSSTYGDHPALPKVEDRIGKPLSPYAVTKYVNELYAHVFALNYDFPSVGLRYFNCFGPRQNRNGPYAAVIPNWITAMIQDEPIYINGDGETSRDFTFIENAIQGNLLAATAERDAHAEIFNMAVGDRTTLNELFRYLKESVAEQGVDYHREPVYRDFRPGDVRHSLADTSRIRESLGYQPTHTIRQGLQEAAAWFVKALGNANPQPVPRDDAESKVEVGFDLPETGNP